MTMTMSFLPRITKVLVVKAETQKYLFTEGLMDYQTPWYGLYPRS